MNEEASPLVNEKLLKFLFTRRKSSAIIALWRRDSIAHNYTGGLGSK